MVICYSFINYFDDHFAVFRFASIFTLGLYYFISRVFFKRRRSYTIHVTNIHIVVKEEMLEEQWSCAKIIHENQITFPLSSVTFLTAEEMGAIGFIVPSVVLEMRLHHKRLL